MSSPTDFVEYTPDEDEPLSVAVVNALSEAKGRDITEEGCVLYDYIDIDSLDGMFREKGSEDTIKVEFTTNEAIVILWGNGRVTIHVKDIESDDSHD